MMKVYDNGHRGSQQGLGSIFEPLFSIKQTGTSPGSIICKNIIEQHEDKIKARSKEECKIILATTVIEPSIIKVIKIC